MGAVLFPLALALMLGGAASVYFGAPIITIERGWTMVIAGSVTGSAGAVLLGLAVAGERLKRIERALVAGPPGSDRAEAGRASAVAPPSVADGLTRVAPVGSYSAGVNSYDMYADGSIRAVTSDGERRFESMEAFRAFMTARGNGDPAAGVPVRPERDGGPAA